ncbi:uncharacterized protein CDV56_102861 [Aspergillus thermomutatus]|uniref:Uncharacterized protein n=1 Tax=Aspergillus thermomutatus TaxID=41047 RepID=A0A397HXM3_ASPTH|nr:uncharacterized protein CDV56_102861 [Aspergillus thermomutatus]RHZ65944.1 hypothetical protein CDV56_102861 [Aspergillus thermomutatus]
MTPSSSQANPSHINSRVGVRMLHQAHEVNPNLSSPTSQFDQILITDVDIVKVSRTGIHKSFITDVGFNVSGNRVPMSLIINIDIIDVSDKSMISSPTL